VEKTQLFILTAAVKITEMNWQMAC